MAATPTRHVEIETKLDLAAGKKIPDLPAVRSVRAAGLVSWSDPVVHELAATYYDTATFDLLHTKITLRRRTGGDDAGWHLKLPAAAGARTEIRLPLEGPDAAIAVPAALTELLFGLTRGRVVEPVALVQNRRTVRRLSNREGRCAVEVADDHVTSTPLQPDGRPSGATRRWRELEAELVDGTRAELAATVTALREAGATPSASASKLARALNRPQPNPKPVRRREKSAGDAIVDALVRLRDAWLVTDLAVREGTPQSLHDARAATRRLHSVLSVFAPLFDGAAGPSVRQGLQEHSRVLSTARDLEVIDRRLRHQLVDEPTDYAQDAAARLEQEFRRRRPVALAQVAARMRSADYLLLLRGLDEFVAGAARTRRASRLALAELPGLLDAAWRELRTRADTALAEPDNVAAVHRVRKQAKVVRYATEASVAVLGDDAAAFAAAIEEVQEVLGEHQDAVMTAALLAELARSPETGGVAGFVFGRLHAFEQAAAHGSLDDFADAWDRVEDGDLLAAVLHRRR